MLKIMAVVLDVILADLLITLLLAEKNRTVRTGWFALIIVFLLNAILIMR